MWDNWGKVAVPASVANQGNGSDGMWIVGVGWHGDFHQLHVLPHALQADARSELELGADGHGLVDGNLAVDETLEGVGSVFGQMAVVSMLAVNSTERRRLLVQRHFVLQPTGRFLHNAWNAGAMRAVEMKIGFKNRTSEKNFVDSQTAGEARGFILNNRRLWWLTHDN